MTRKRSKLQIYLDILKVVNKGTKKPTKIMYKTNLSWKPLMKILESMIEQELIIQRIIHKRTVYEVTMKGKNVLNYFAKVMQLIELR